MNETEYYHQIDQAQDIIFQTSDFRFKRCWEGPRNQLKQRGYTLNKCFQISCDPGEADNSTQGDFILSDKTIASIEFSPKGEISKFERTENSDCFDEKFCLSLLDDPEMLEAFNKSCEAYYDLFWKKKDVL